MRCVVGQPFAAGPWFPPDTASVSTIYIVISIWERVNTFRLLSCTICPDSSFRAVKQALLPVYAVLSLATGVDHGPTGGLVCALRARWPAGGAAVRLDPGAAAV